MKIVAEISDFGSYSNLEVRDFGEHSGVNYTMNKYAVKVYGQDDFKNVPDFILKHFQKRIESGEWCLITIENGIKYEE